MSVFRFFSELSDLERRGNLRSLPSFRHEGKYVFTNDGNRLLNLSSNDYLGLTNDVSLRNEFFSSGYCHELLSSSSSRLLTGNFEVYEILEGVLARKYNRESALLFNSGYHANIGILPAVCNRDTLILADKLVHASIIDGIRLSGAVFKRYRHNDYDHLESLLASFASAYETVIVVTESVFSMDGDIADLKRLVSIKRSVSNVLLYVDEAHAVGVRGVNGLGIAEECGCIADIDFLVGTFGKALASVGAFVVCDAFMRRFLINKMRPLIFSTALPPLNIAWSLFLFERISLFGDRRMRLHAVSSWFRKRLEELGRATVSESHIVPYVVGENNLVLLLSERLREGGFLALPVRPPTVPAGSSRIRFSLTSDIDMEELDVLISLLS